MSYNQVIKNHKYNNEITKIINDVNNKVEKINKNIINVKLSCVYNHDLQCNIYDYIISKNNYYFKIEKTIEHNNSDPIIIKNSLLKNIQKDFIYIDNEYETNDVKQNVNFNNYIDFDILKKINFKYISIKPALFNIKNYIYDDNNILYSYSVINNIKSNNNYINISDGIIFEKIVCNSNNIKIITKIQVNSDITKLLYKTIAPLLVKSTYMNVNKIINSI